MQTEAFPGIDVRHFIASNDDLAIAINASFKTKDASAIVDELEEWLLTRGLYIRVRIG